MKQKKWLIALVVAEIVLAGATGCSKPPPGIDQKSSAPAGTSGAGAASGTKQTGGPTGGGPGTMGTPSGTGSTGGGG